MRVSSHVQQPAFEAVIGLEVHVQLATRTKMFSPDPVCVDAPPNTRVHEVSLGLPGTLPTINGRAIELAVRAGLALECTVHAWSRFARKHYMYPDLPKGYQITQHHHPLCTDGTLRFEHGEDMHTCRITRVHVEEDTGRSVHPRDADMSWLDYNRAGIALIEVVSAPDLRTPGEASAYLRVLHEVLVWLGVTEGNMESGHLRCDANVSIRRVGDSALGTRVELKNINSFRFVEAALAHEVTRQATVIEGGGAVVAETRRWDPKTGRTQPLRRKERVADYRFIPEPDLPPLVLDPAWIDTQRQHLPMLPAARRAHYATMLGLTATQARQITRDREMTALFEATLEAGGEAGAMARLLCQEVSRVLNARGATVAALAIEASHMLELQALLDEGMITSNVVGRVMDLMLDERRAPRAVVSTHGLGVVRDDAPIVAAIEQVLAGDPEQVARYRAGERKLVGYFMGSVMRRLSGQGDPGVVRRHLLERLDDV